METNDWKKYEEVLKNASQRLKIYFLHFLANFSMTVTHENILETSTQNKMVVAPIEIIQANVKKLICYTIKFVECKSRAPLGMSIGYISSNQLKAESSKGKAQPSQARLHLAETAWQCDRWVFPKECWFQVCLIGLDLTVRSSSGMCYQNSCSQV